MGILTFSLKKCESASLRTTRLVKQVISKLLPWGQVLVIKQVVSNMQATETADIQFSKQRNDLTTGLFLLHFWTDFSLIEVEERN